MEVASALFANLFKDTGRWAFLLIDLDYQIVVSYLFV